MCGPDAFYPKTFLGNDHRRMMKRLKSLVYKTLVTRVYQIEICYSDQRHCQC